MKYRNKKSILRSVQRKYQTHLPKVDPYLVYDCCYDSKKSSAYVYDSRGIYKKGIDSEEAKMYIIQKTGMVPSVYDKGTHYVTNQKLTLEILKEISDCEDVLEVAGEYSGSCGSIGSVHERSEKYE